MKDIASTIADRIRNTFESGAADRAEAPVAGMASRQAFKETVARAFVSLYGVSLDEVTDTLPTANDIVWAAAESNTSPREFVGTLASQHALRPIGDTSTAGYIAGENRAKLAVAEFARFSEGWTFYNGNAVSADETDADASIVIAPYFDEIRRGWVFQSAVVAVDKDRYLSLSPSDAARIPMEDVVIGDLSDCAERAVSYRPTVQSSMSM